MKPENRWTRKSIGHVAQIIGGGTPSTKDPDNFSGDIPWLTPKDLSGWPSRWIARGHRNITQKGLESSTARLLPPKSVLVSSRAPIGYVALAENDIATNQGFRSLVPKDDNVPEFLYYLMRHLTPVLEAAASGTTFKEISGSALERIEITVPPVQEQQRIAWILGKFDDKIDSNRRLTALLDETVATLFRVQFIDRIDLSKRHIAHPRPSNWSAVTVKDLTAEIYNGGTPRRMEPNYWNEGTIPWFKTGELTDGFLPRRSAICITEQGLADSNCRLLPRGTVLMAIYAAPTVGRLGILDGDGACNQACTALIPSQSVGYPFLFYTLRNLREYFISVASGSAQQNISKRIVESAPAVLPPNDALHEFNASSLANLEMIAAIHRESQSLAGLRDALLPKLISGEIRVPDTNDPEEIIEPVAEQFAQAQL